MRTFIETAKQRLAPLYTPQEINRIARLLLEKWASVDAVSFYADKDRKIPASELAKLQLALDKLVRSEPLEYVLGKAEFVGMQLNVDNRVLIPRPETEELVEWIRHDAREHGYKTPERILDVCTGSGCIALALFNEWPVAHVEGWDISAAALEVATQNAGINQASIGFSCVDVLTVEPSMYETGLFDLIVSNPPYVCRSESTHMSSNVLDYEPHLALFVEDEDPLIFYAAIARLGKKLLKPEGNIYVEINAQLAEQTKKLFENEGFSMVILRKDLFGKDRFVKAKR
jgi:release factor glutamine methyltransferase